MRYASQLYRIEFIYCTRLWVDTTAMQKEVAGLTFTPIFFYMRQLTLFTNKVLNMHMKMATSCFLAHEVSKKNWPKNVFAYAQAKCY